MKLQYLIIGKIPSCSHCSAQSRLSISANTPCLSLFSNTLQLPFIRDKRKMYFLIKFDNRKVPK